MAVANQRMRLALCDDDSAALGRLVGFCHRFAEERGTVLDVREFSSTYDLDEVPTLDFDLIVLDILMESKGTRGLDGMQLAHRIRRTNPRSIIAFATSAPGFAVEGYTVGASYFLVKPVGYEDFSCMLEGVLARLVQAPKAMLVVNDGTDRVMVACEDVSFVESARNASVIHANGGVWRQPVPLSVVERRLGDRFFRVHAGFVVNVDRVKRVGMAELTMEDGTRIPLSKHRRKEFMTALHELLADRML